eukprot:Gb_02495 [translate_table: standard]
MWLVRDNSFRFARTSGTVGCSLPHERTFSELMICGVYGICHYPSPDLGSIENVQTPSSSPRNYQQLYLVLNSGGRAYVFGSTRESPQMEESDLNPGKATLYPVPGTYLWDIIVRLRCE